MHWAKNLLLVVPVVTAHAWTSTAIASALLAAVAFSFAASAIYLVNDVLDAPYDRQHPRKRTRPVAARELPTGAAVVGAVALAGAAVATGQLVGSTVVWWLGVYGALMLSYSAWIKRLVALDVVVLAIGYTMRLAAGAAAIAVKLSPWLAAFSLFVFLSLALLKRASELGALRGDARADAPPFEAPIVYGRGYVAGDADAVATLGMGAATLAVLVLALYVTSPEVQRLYRQPEVLWLLCPTVTYWQMRFWLLARRGVVADDPVLYALRDLPSLCVLVTCVACVVLAL